MPLPVNKDLLVWSDDLLTGVSEIDTHHRELFNLMNWFLKACERGTDKEQIKRVFEFLDKYIIYHFNAEEEYMAHYDYPNYAVHQQMHTDFKKDFAQLKKKFEDALSGPTVLKILRVQVETNELLGQWWIDHINKTDKTLGVFLKSRIKE